MVTSHWPCCIFHHTLPTSGQGAKTKTLKRPAPASTFGETMGGAAKKPAVSTDGDESTLKFSMPSCKKKGGAAIKKRQFCQAGFHGVTVWFTIANNSKTVNSLLSMSSTNRFQNGCENFWFLHGFDFLIIWPLERLP